MTTISLCMIVKDEIEVIERCLNSVKSLIDEVIIVDTGSKDNTVALCQKLGAHVTHYEWCNDFSRARNFAFQQATSDYIFWLDADDVITPDQLELLSALKPRLQHDVYFLKYDYSQDEYGVSTCSFFRERIVKNDGSFQWIYPIHEVIDGTNGRSSSYENIVIKHQRTTAGHTQDYGRNLDILSQAMLNLEYQNVPRMWYYYGRELADHNRYEEAIKALETFISFPHSWIEDQMGAYTKMATCHLHLYRELEEKHTTNHHFKAREAARRAIAIDEAWAEPYFVMGEIAFELLAFEEAIFWFKKCLRPMPDVLSALNIPIYSISTYINLMFCCDRLQDFEQANNYNEQALACKPNDVGLLHNRSYFQELLYPTVLDQTFNIAWFGKNIDPNFPTYRIRAIQLNTALNNLGFNSEMIDDEADLYTCNTIIFFKAINESEYRTMKRMKALGKQIVFDLAEDLFQYTFDFPFYIPMLETADLVTCCSHELAKKIKVHNSNVQVIEDPIEQVLIKSDIRIKDQLIFGWIGMPENAMHAEELRPLIESMGGELRTIHSGPNHDRLWTMNDWQSHLAQCDIAIAPIDISTQPCKSNNKLTTYQSLGLPVIAAPLDAYKRIILPHHNGVIATTKTEWRTAIEQLKNSEFRKKLRDGGLATSLRFRPKNLALKLVKAISVNHYDSFAVDIIIPTIYPTAHLKLCIDSILACTTVPYNIIKSTMVAMIWNYQKTSLLYKGIN